MKIAVNLATRPFVELGSLFRRLRWIMASLLLLGVVLLVIAHVEQVKLNRQQADMDALRRQTLAVQRETLNDQARMHQPANQLVLDRAHFLNTLFLRKSFSWTAVMMDLEHVLPTGVQVTAIEPQVTSDGDVTIRLRVSGERDRAVQLVRNLEHSSRFLHPRLSAETSQTRQNTTAAVSSPALANGAANAPAATGNVEFDILANYNPLPAPAGTYADAGETTADSDTATLPQPHHARTPHARTAFTPGPNDGVVLKPFVGSSGRGKQ